MVPKRCQPGDLAVVVHSTAGNLGRFVRVLAPAVGHDWLVRSATLLECMRGGEPCASREAYARDDQLWPIRDPVRRLEEGIGALERALDRLLNRERA